MIEQEAREILEVGHVDMQQVIHVAGQRVAGDHFIPAVDVLDETLDRFRLVLAQLHTHESLQAQANRLRIDLRRVAGDDLVRFQPLQPAQARRWRQADPLGQLGIGDAALALQDGEQAQVGAVECRHAQQTSVIPSVCAMIVHSQANPWQQNKLRAGKPP